MKKIHLIGIGGAGLSAIAKVLLESGYQVSGSDRAYSDSARQVQKEGAHVYIGHRAEQILGADIVVRSSAISNDNVEVLTAMNYGIPVLKRGEFLEELTSTKKVIAVAGTHGKTTCTSMIAWMLSELELDPSYIIGGKSLNLGTNAHAGKGEYFIIEADEYDRMFWGLKPEIAVVTNVEHDHVDFYPTPEDFFQAFVGFIERIQPGGILITCDNDPGAALLRTRAAGMDIKTYSYGDTGSHYNCYSRDEALNTVGGYAFRVSCSSQNGTHPASSAEINLRVPGRFNIRNALAALAVAHVLDLPLVEAARALNNYQGTGRRFELVGEKNGITLIDDYAHHPTEIRSTLRAARERYAARPIWVVWQPHTYSRTRALIEDYVSAFEDADHLLVTEIYAARETEPDDGFSANSLVQEINHQDSRFVPDLGAARDFLIAHLKPGDILLVFSAGDGDQLNREILDQLKQNPSGDDNATTSESLNSGEWLSYK